MSQSVTSGQIQFNEIPYVWKVPGNYMEVKEAVNQNALLAFPARGLITGQMYSTGTATPGTKYMLLSAAQANALFGAGSQAATMAAFWLAANPYTPCDIIGIADAAESAKAAGAVTVAGTATAPGTLPILIGGIRVATPVNIGDTAADVAANFYAQCQLQGQPGYPYFPSVAATYVAAALSVALTCQHGGTLGNNIDVRVSTQSGDEVPAGLSVTITPMTGGATDPDADVAAAFSGLTNTWYTDVAFAWTDLTNVDMLTSWAAERYGAMVKLDVQAYVGLGGTYGTILNFAPNSQYLSPLPMQNPLTAPWAFAASLAGACCYSTAQKPSLQMRTVPLPGVVAPAEADLFTLPEREVLLQSGFSTFTVDSTGIVYLERVTTSYRTDPSGVLNSAWFDLSSVKVPTRVRYDWDGYISLLYPRNNLTDDGTIGADYDPDAVTPSRLLGSWAARSTVYEQNGWIQNSATTVKASSFAIDPNDGNRVNARQQIQIMGNLIVLAGSLEFISNN